jgi:hypothetical protein
MRAGNELFVQVPKEGAALVGADLSYGVEPEANCLKSRRSGRPGASRRVYRKYRHVVGAGHAPKGCVYESEPA